MLVQGMHVVAHRKGEQGSSVVSFVMVLPLLAVLTGAIVDLGRIALAGIELDCATQAVSRWASTDVSQGSARVFSDASASGVLRESSSALRLPDFDCKASVYCSDVERTSYERKSYNEKSGSFQQQSDAIACVEVSVCSTLTGRCITPIGNALVGLSGSDAGRFTLSSQASRVVRINEKGGEHAAG